jgi:hypothetical protein
MAREVPTQCERGLLRYTDPNIESLKPTGSWSDRRKSRGYNLFYGDVEADVQARLAVWTARRQG